MDTIKSNRDRIVRRDVARSRRRQQASIKTDSLSSARCFAPDRQRGEAFARQQDPPSGPEAAQHSLYQISVGDEIGRFRVQPLIATERDPLLALCNW